MYLIHGQDEGQDGQDEAQDRQDSHEAQDGQDGPKTAKMRHLYIILISPTFVSCGIYQVFPFGNFK